MRVGHIAKNYGNLIYWIQHQNMRTIFIHIYPASLIKQVINLNPYIDVSRCLKKELVYGFGSNTET